MTEWRQTATDPPSLSEYDPDDWVRYPVLGSTEDYETRVWIVLEDPKKYPLWAPCPSLGQATDLRTLQAEVVEWQKQFPRSNLDKKGNKLGEECGEVCRAINRLDEGRGTVEDLEGEIGDVLIVLAAICGLAKIDMHEAAMKRWNDDVSQRQYGLKR